MVRFLVEHGACVFATTFSDHETAAEKCEEDEEGFIGCSEYLYSIQEKLGIMNSGEVFAVYEYSSPETDELNLEVGDALTVMKKGDENEKDWWWARRGQDEGYIPKNLLGLFARVEPGTMTAVGEKTEKEEDSVDRKEASSESSASSSGGEEQIGGHHLHMEDHHPNNGSSSA